MILTDREILLALDSGRILIDPHPGYERVSSTAVDLTLADEFQVWQPVDIGGASKPIPLGAPGYSFAKLAATNLKTIHGSYVLPPQGFVLGWTAEKVKLPIDSMLAARVEGKSSVARLGVGIHVTAPTVHSGFGQPNGNRIQLEIFNWGTNAVELNPGTPICQLIFELTLGVPNAGYSGQFRSQ